MNIPVSDDEIYLSVPPGCGIARINVISPAITDEQKAQAEAGETIELCYRMEAVPTPEFEEWAKANGIPFRMDLYDDGIKVTVDQENHLLWIKLRWT